MANIANAYRKSGNDAMPTYDDSSHSARGSAAFTALHLETHIFDQVGPGLREYLDGFPRYRFDQARDALYWARDEQPGLQPTTTLNDRFFYSSPGAAGATIVADHYLEAGLEVIAVVSRPGPAGAGVYLVVPIRLDSVDLRRQHAGPPGGQSTGAHGG